MLSNLCLIFSDIFLSVFPLHPRPPLTTTGELQVDVLLSSIEGGEDGAALKQYTAPLRDMTLIRLLKQVAQVRRRDTVLYSDQLIIIGIEDQ